MSLLEQTPSTEGDVRGAYPVSGVFEIIHRFDEGPSEDLREELAEACRALEKTKQETKKQLGEFILDALAHYDGSRTLFREYVNRLADEQLKEEKDKDESGNVILLSPDGEYPEYHASERAA